VADTSIINLYSNFMGFRYADFDVFNGQILAGLPGNSSLASDGLCEISAIVFCEATLLFRGVG